MKKSAFGNYGVVVALHSDLRFENGVIPDGTQTGVLRTVTYLMFENGVIPDGISHVKSCE